MEITFSGTAKNARAEFSRMVDALTQRAIPKAVTDLVLDVRDQAEENRQNALSTSGEKFRVGPRVKRFKRGQGVGGRAVSEADMKSWRPGDDLYIYSTEFYDYFHEKGYYSGTGGARPKWMLRNALVSVGERDVEV